MALLPHFDASAFGANSGLMQTRFTMFAANRYNCVEIQTTAEAAQGGYAFKTVYLPPSYSRNPWRPDLFFRFAISRISFVFLALALSMGIASAQEEQQKDHPSIPGFPGYAIDTEKVNEFDSFEFPLEENNKTVEGKFWQITYQIKEGARKPSELEVYRNYENQFKARGGRLLYQGSGTNGATMMMPLGKGERWLNVSIVNAREAL